MSSKDHARADDPQRQDEARQDEQTAELQSYLDLRAVMSRSTGRRTLHRILEKLGAGLVVPQGGGPLAYDESGPLDVHSTMLNLGAQLVGEELKFAWAVACPEEFIEMTTEQVRDLAERHEHTMRKKRAAERRIRRGEEEVDDQVVDEEEST